MKLQIIASLAVAASAAYGNPAREFTCLGQESLGADSAGAKFSVVYEDWVEEGAYATELVLIKSTVLDQDLELNLKDLREDVHSSECAGASLKEMEHLGGDSGVYLFELNGGDCEGVPAYSLVGYCEKKN